MSSILEHVLIVPLVTCAACGVGSPEPHKNEAVDVSDRSSPHASRETERADGERRAPARPSGSPAPGEVRGEPTEDLPDPASSDELDPAIPRVDEARCSGPGSEPLVDGLPAISDDGHDIAYQGESPWHPDTGRRFQVVIRPVELAVGERPTVFWRCADRHVLNDLLRRGRFRSLRPGVVRSTRRRIDVSAEGIERFRVTARLRNRRGALVWQGHRDDASAWRSDEIYMDWSPDTGWFDPRTTTVLIVWSGQSRGPSCALNYWTADYLVARGTTAG